VAAIGGKHRSGHEGTGLRDTQEQRTVEVPGPAEATLRNAAAHRPSGIGGQEVAVEAGLGMAGCQSVHTASVSRPFQSLLPRQPDQPTIAKHGIARRKAAGARALGNRRGALA